jgi:asparagine synthase (glutamine-hydrolysing)
MCGISGIVDLRDTRPVDRARLARMNALLAHRGPDGDEIFEAPGVGFGHRRLAIIDVGGGRQPMFNETGSVAVIYNGMLYNFQELAEELTRRGHRFRTRCDTEVLVHAWEEWGAACLERFRGMYAFALWDADRQTLFLARDRLGKKPLYYAIADDRIVFASELQAVVAGLPEEPELDTQAVEDYFAFGYVPDPKTIFRGVRKLPPAHHLVLTRGKGVPAPTPYWDLRFPEPDGRPEAELTAELAERLRDSVRMRLISDVPLGAFLSGGVDSSAVVAFMAQASTTPIRTCSIGFGDARFDESRYAAAVAERYGTAHFTKRVDVDAYALIDRLAAAYCEPFADSSALPTYMLSALAREKVTVALSGDGGDEVFAGYRRYALHLREEQVKRMLPAGLRRPLFGTLAAVYPKLDWAPRFLRGKATFEALSQDAVGGYFRAVTLLPTPLRRRLYSGDFRAALDGYEAIEVLREHGARAGTEDPVARAQYIDLKTWLAGGMLTKVDRASMANSLEVRTPLLDHRLVEWAAGLPLHLKIRGTGGKYLLKKAVEPLLPHDLLYRPKQGFSVPLRSWLRNELAGHVEALVSASKLTDCGLFDGGFLRRLATEHRSGRVDHGRTLWALIMFDAFLRRPWLESRATGPRSAAPEAAE